MSEKEKEERKRREGKETREEGEGGKCTWVTISDARPSTKSNKLLACVDVGASDNS